MGIKNMLNSPIPALSRSVGVLCWCAGKGGRPGAVGRGSLCPLLGTLLAGAPARAPSETRPQIRRAHV